MWLNLVVLIFVKVALKVSFQLESTRNVLMEFEHMFNQEENINMGTKV